MIRIVSLYPRDMNLYGDWGNAHVLRQRMAWRGIDAEIIDHNSGDDTDFATADIFLGGGGQDAGQDLLQDDLASRGPELAERIADGVPTLLVCGMYQLLGRSFVTGDGEVIKGAGILPLETRAGTNRLTGNITLDSPEFGLIVGYENHSGRTYLDEGVAPLGTVVRGAGNNGEDSREGIRVHNLIGTYLHGPVLPSNPKVADFLIATALRRRGLPADLAPLEVDEIAARAHTVAQNRPR